MLFRCTFYASAYERVTTRNQFFNIGVYLRQLQLKQYREKSFHISLVNGELLKTEDTVKQEVESQWTAQDKRNMNYVISTVGYDPFDDAVMSDNDKKYCYNTMAGYCDTDGITDDGHKLQSCIQITNTRLQCKKIDELFNQELLSVTPNEARLKSLAEFKAKLLSTINVTAKENHITSRNNEKSKVAEIP